MLKRSSLQKKEFKQDELTQMKRLDFNDIEIIKSDNLGKLLIWTSELAQYNHAQYIEFSHKLKNVEEVEEREEINNKIKFYRNNAFSENQIKDFYLKRLLDQGEATVKGYIKHPIKQDTKYAVISYHGYNFISFATPEIIEKFPLHLIDFVQRETPKALADIHPDEALLLSTIKNFINPFKEQYKKITRKNREIKEHNAVVHEIFIKIKNKEATLHKEMVKNRENPILEVTEKKSISVKVKDIPVQQDLAQKQKSVTVIKKRKFALIKDK